MRVPVAVVDSMQVYRELPIITNQARERDAEMVGVTSVEDEWTMARHRSLVDRISESSDAPLILDAGTGMYLNSILLDIDIYPKVSGDLRRLAESLAEGKRNHRRSAREKELELHGSRKPQEKGSIWEGDFRYEFRILYLRPGEVYLEDAIRRRSKTIAQRGTGEVKDILDSYSYQEINYSVRESIGFKELRACLLGEITQKEAESRIFIRTRRLSVRQTRWFDKLVRVLGHRAEILTLEGLEELPEAENLVSGWGVCE